MAIDPTVREANVKDSIKKFFVDALTAAGIKVNFDRTLNFPAIEDKETDKWVTIIFGSLEQGALATMNIVIYCCSRKDNEGFKLSQLRDSVMDLLVDTEQTDTNARIPLYRSAPGGFANWTLIGAMAVRPHTPSKEYIAQDGTKFKYMGVTLYWGAIA